MERQRLCAAHGGVGWLTFAVRQQQLEGRHGRFTCSLQATGFFLVDESMTDAKELMLAMVKQNGFDADDLPATT